MLRQYWDNKAMYPDSILFFRMGDFYEMFFEDAEIASRILEITLTSRDKNKAEKIPMCGVPVHAAENYLTRLVQAGRKVAICEQVEDPKKAKGLVKREVVRVVTPGLITTEGSIEGKTNNFLVAVAPAGSQVPWGLSYVDLSTGEFKVTELVSEHETFSEIFRLEPAEILLPDSFREADLPDRLKQTALHAFFSFRPEIWFDRSRAASGLMEYFKILSLDGFGLSGFSSGLGAAGALLAYITETQKGETSHISRLTPYNLSRHLIIDEATKRNLELVGNSIDYGRTGTLLEILDITVTSMGGRLMRNWILRPLQDLSEIEGRLDALETIKNSPSARAALRKRLRRVYDLERLTARTVMGTASGKDLLGLKDSLIRIPAIKEHLSALCPDSTLLTGLYGSLDPLEDIVELIDLSIREDCPAVLREGRLIKEGFNSDLDELIHLQRDGRSFLAGIESREREKTGIAKLKIGYNRVFGYYIEVSRGQLDKIPEDYIRKQTLVGAERFITPELKEIESRILTAQEDRLNLEYELFQKVRKKTASAAVRIQKTASALAVLDCLAALAETAEKYNYARPSLNKGDSVSINLGRHPVVEHTLHESFVPNDIELNHDDSKLIIITGPNMAGKSTVLRQTALIVLMAHMGSFVPAEKAEIGMVDRIFTRVGATDYLARGQSTFMVEMSETANILHNATGRSLLILDEIGRGTSTYDGLSIAWAVAEHLLYKDEKGIKTLFATHYHELTELSNEHPGVRNMHIAVKEWEDQIIFLRRLVQGATNRSYGIQVAALAGVPSQVINKAKEVLARIERTHSAEIQMETDSGLSRNKTGRVEQMTLPLLPDSESEIRDRLLTLDVNNMTPIEALNILAELKKSVDER
ncbi:MAG TPA: DNA mismatch repair protein MutS [Thermodesulfobacteriaceae bacterium]|nr:DNA mismatch repair protein MutS [Thermodesulfobacteriaceae bacterium]